MVSVFDLDDQRCAYSSKAVRMLAGNPSPATWAKLRALLGITSHNLSLREAFLLWVGAQCCRYRHDLDKSGIYGAAIALLAQKPEAIEHVKELSGGACKAADLPGLIQRATGRPVSESTLYSWNRIRNLPRYSRDKNYTAAQVTRYINYATRLQRYSESDQNQAKNA